MSPADLTKYSWSPQPEATNFCLALLADCLHHSDFARQFERRMLNETGTRLFDWIDHFGLTTNDPLAAQLSSIGFLSTAAFPDQTGGEVWQHPGGLLPRIRIHTKKQRHLAIKVESIVDFLVAQRLANAEIEGPPEASVRKALVAESQSDTSSDGVEIWVMERHGSLKFDADSLEAVPLASIMKHAEAFRLRRRDFATDPEGFAHAEQLIDASIRELGQDRTCDLFFAAEREFWLQRNRAGQVQKARQDQLGLGWANHDHHTYRSSRHCFALLIALLERMGFQCRERFYAGREAGWGAQVIEHPVTGVTIFADVDLSPEELTHDFAHEPLSPRNRLGTVGLWCALHGEAFLQGGMHHLECQFDFSATRDQLKQAGIETMPPFTDFPYLRQAFTKGEIWHVNPQRIEQLLNARLITPEQARQFRISGALGSHLEILQRNDGYKGFNQSGINQIIAATDPRYTSTGLR